ncbi:hypothetical protein [Bartonella sp. AD13SXNS]|uniref:hypothetical protein n=1 Tax=Bartonella sp. AD13SXNS TaxID=3243462 RepID=UPI0035D0E6E9
MGEERVLGAHARWRGIAGGENENGSRTKCLETWWCDFGCFCGECWGSTMTGKCFFIAGTMVRVMLSFLGCAAWEGLS